MIQSFYTHSVKPQLTLQPKGSQQLTNVKLYSSHQVQSKGFSIIHCDILAQKQTIRTLQVLTI